MASAQELASSETPKSFEEFYGEWSRENYPLNVSHDPYSLFTKAANIFDGRIDKQRDAYQDYLNKFEAKEAEKSENSARAFEEYMSSTAIQRAVKDAIKAGLNPRMILEGSLQSASTPSAQGVYNISRSSSSSTSRSDSKSSSFSSSAVIVGLIAALIKLAAL